MRKMRESRRRERGASALALSIVIAFIFIASMAALTRFEKYRSRAAIQNRLAKTRDRLIEEIKASLSNDALLKATYGIGMEPIRYNGRLEYRLSTKAISPYWTPLLRDVTKGAQVDALVWLRSCVWHSAGYGFNPAPAAPPGTITGFECPRSGYTPKSMMKGKGPQVVIHRPAPFYLVRTTSSGGAKENVLLNAFPTDFVFPAGVLNEVGQPETPYRPTSPAPLPSASTLYPFDGSLGRFDLDGQSCTAASAKCPFSALARFEASCPDNEAAGPDMAQYCLYGSRSVKVRILFVQDIDMGDNSLHGLRVWEPNPDDGSHSIEIDSRRFGPTDDTGAPPEQPPPPNAFTVMEFTRVDWQKDDLTPGKKGNSFFDKTIGLLDDEIVVKDLGPMFPVWLNSPALFEKAWPMPSCPTGPDPAHPDWVQLGPDVHHEILGNSIYNYWAIIALFPLPVQHRRYFDFLQSRRTCVATKSTCRFIKIKTASNFTLKNPAPPPQCPNNKWYGTSPALYPEPVVRGHISVDASDPLAQIDPATHKANFPPAEDLYGFNLTRVCATCEWP